MFNILHKSGILTKLYSYASNYEGTANELAGCINDQKDLVEKLEISHTLLTGTECDKLNVKDLWFEALGRWQKDCVHPIIQISGHGTRGKDPHGREDDGYCEGQYLDSGEVLWDFELWNDILSKFPVEALLRVIADICHSDGQQRIKGTQKKRFVDNLSTPYMYKETPNIRKRSTSLNYAWLSACREDETAADATFKGRANGAMTYYFLKNYRKDDSFFKDYKRAKKKINRLVRFSQHLVMSGNPKIYNLPLVI